MTHPIDSSSPYMPFLYDLPTNSVGRLTPSTMMRSLGARALRWQLEKKPFIAVYSGSRTGKSPNHMAVAKELGQSIENVEGVAVTGGTSPGLMGAVLNECSRQVCFIPKLFASRTGAGVAIEDVHAHAVNHVVPDFWERKTAMTLIADAGFIVLPGGYGSLDEAFESLIFAARTNRRVTFVNPNGYWDSTLSLFSSFAKQGLMPPEYLNCISSAPDASTAVEGLLQHQQANAKNTLTPQKKAIATTSLRNFFETNPQKLPNAIFSFIGKAPRIGLIASGNIGKEEADFNLSQRTYRSRFVDNTTMIARQFVKAGAALVLMGDRRGLRARMAQAALEAGGKVIWLQRNPTRLPLNIRRLNEQEMQIDVPRYFERARLFATIVQGQCIIAGGIHTANEALSHVTRNQTGHGDYCDVVPHCRDMGRPRMVAHAYDPHLDDNGLRLWEPLAKQVWHCANEGFINKKDLGLLLFHRRAESITGNVMSGLGHQPDFLVELSKMGKQRSPSSTPVPCAPKPTLG